MQSNAADLQIPDATPKPPRFVELDALRGLAILGMALSGMLPRGGLPAWMYHAQTPPPTHAFDPAVPGITWVDLVFPFFLFSMGAAMPLALGPRIRSGVAIGNILLDVLKRTLILAAFALYVQHINPWLIEKSPGTQTWLIALLGFALLFPALARLPEAWPLVLRIGLRGVGFGGAIALCASLRFADGSGWRLTRSDIILVVLTNVWLFGALLWLATRRMLIARLLIMLALIGFRLWHDEAAWLSAAWRWSPLPWIYQAYFLQYLLIVLPGTIVGDWLAEQAATTGQSRDGVPKPFASGALFGPLLAVLGTLLFLGPGAPAARAATLALAALTFGITCVSLSRSGPARLWHVAAWGAAWLALGVALEPLEGGIKKDPSNLSYYFATSGLACFVLIVFIAASRLRSLSRCTEWLAATGANPILAYAAIRDLLPPMLGLLGVEALAQRVLSGAWPLASWAVAKTLLLAAIVVLFTRRRLYLRA